MGVSGERGAASIPVAAVSTDPLERRLYAHDLAVVPSLLSGVLLRATPDAVARPRTAAEVAALLGYAAEHRLAVTPRAAGSTAFHNAVPARGGVLVDVQALRGIVAVDEARQTATVQAATRWQELDDELRYGWGLAVKTYPTSAPAATVGGWFNMGGLGVGSLKYGALRDLVERAEVILPNGEAHTLSADSQPPLNWFAGAEGTLGVVTRLELSLRPAPEATSSHLLAFGDPAALQRAALALAGTAPRPYHLHFADEAHARMVGAAGFMPVVPEGRHSLLVRYEGSATEVAAGADEIRAVARAHGGQELPRPAAEEAWQHRFSEVRIKRAGPSLLGVEVLLPLTQLAAFVATVQRLGQQYAVPIYAYGSIVGGDYAQPNAFFLADERRGLPYLLSLGITKKLHEAAYGLGGRPYGVGLWNTPYLGHAYSALDRRELHRRKRLLDPAGIMNPGKLYAAPLPAPIFALGMDALALLHRIGNWARGSTPQSPGTITAAEVPGPSAQRPRRRR